MLTTKQQNKVRIASQKGFELSPSELATAVGLAFGLVLLVGFAVAYGQEPGEQFIEHMREVDQLDTETSFITHNNDTEVIVIVGPASVQQPYEDTLTDTAATYGYDMLVYQYVSDKLYLIFVEVAA